MAADPIRALTGRRRTRPTSPGCRRPRQPEPGGTPLIKPRAVVQTTGATSIGGLDDSGHIRNGCAYFFTAARSAVLMQLRRARVVSIETVTKIYRLGIVSDEPSAERIVIGRRELGRVTRGVVDTKSGKRKAAPRQALIML